MSRLQSLAALALGATALASVAYLIGADVEVPGVGPAVAAESAVSDSWPEGLELKEPSMPIGVEGSMLELNTSLSAGLRPEDNAVVLLVQVFGNDAFEPELRNGSFDMLGIRTLADAPRMEYVDAFVRSTGAKSDDDAEQMADELYIPLNHAADRSWTREEFPQFAAYLDRNAEALDLVVTAADRPRYYAPLLSPEHPMRLISAAYSVEHRLPFLARCLTARAQLLAGEQDYAGAWRDLIACHKLARLVANGSPLDISCAKAHMVDAMASHAEMSLAVSGKLPGAEAETLIRRLSELPDMPTAEDAANRGERAVVHEELELLRSDDESRRGFFETGTEEDIEALKQLLNTEAYWKIALARVDARQDEMVQLLAIRPHQEQFAQIAISNEEFEKWRAADASESAGDVSFADLAQKNPEDAAEMVGESMAMALRTNPWQRRHTDDRGRMRRNSVIVCLALSAYKSRHAKYPAALAELAPEIVSVAPVDPHSEQPFAYERRADDHVVLTSLGPNQISDAGAIYNDDLTIELK